MDFKKWDINPEHSPNIIIIADPGKDLDDEFTFILAAALHKQGIINLVGVIANLYPAYDRARLARGTFDCLGLPEIPIGVGLPVIAPEHRAKYNYETDVPYLSGRDVFADGQRLLARILDNASDKSLTLVLQSGLTDAWMLYQQDCDRFQRKIAHVVIMGGIVTDDTSNVLLHEGHILPNNANNNSFDLASAVKLYGALQDIEIPMTITMRDAAYASQIPFAVYDDLVVTGNPIGKCLRDRQKPALQKLWEAACSPPSSTIRGTLPKDRDRAWFVHVFCKGQDPGILDGEDIWPYIGDFNLYDPINLLAAVDHRRFFDATAIQIGAANHLVIGLSAERHGVRDSLEIRKFLMEAMIYGLIQWQPLADYGDHMSIKDWLKSFKFGVFNDDDGYGELATETQVSSFKIQPSDWFTKGEEDFPSWATHVVWYKYKYPILPFWL